VNFGAQTENGRFAFLRPNPFVGDLWATYDVHLRHICKARCRLPISVNWTFLLGATAKAPRANIDWKSAILLKRGRLTQNFRSKGSP